MKRRERWFTRALITLLEDPDSLAPTGRLTTTCNSSSRVSMALFWPLWPWGMHMVHRKTWRQNIHTHKISKWNTCTYTHMKKGICSWASKMDQWVKILAIKAGDLSAIPQTHLMIEGKNYPVTSTHASWHAHPHIHIHNIKKPFKTFFKRVYNINDNPGKHSLIRDPFFLAI